MQRKVLVFRIDRTEYAIPFVTGREIKKYPEPLSIGFDYGGETISDECGNNIQVINLSAKFSTEYIKTANRRIVIVEEEPLKIGIVVDEVLDVLCLSAESIQMTPGPGGRQDFYIEGIAGLDNRMIILLDISKLIKIKKMELQAV